MINKAHNRRSQSFRSNSAKRKIAVGLLLFPRFQMLDLAAPGDAFSLESTNFSLNEIARRCGFNSEATLRRAFTHRLGIAPFDYRQRFCSEEKVVQKPNQGEYWSNS
jgi:transcriptional regulator GlxA family with amidase domain